MFIRRLKYTESDFTYTAYTEARPYDDLMTLLLDSRTASNPPFSSPLGKELEAAREVSVGHLCVTRFNVLIPHICGTVPMKLRISRFSSPTNETPHTYVDVFREMEGTHERG